MVNELVWKLGLRSATLVRDALKKTYKFSSLNLEKADAQQLLRLIEELDVLISKTPTRRVEVKVLSVETTK